MRPGPQCSPTLSAEHPDLKPYMVVPHAVFSDDVLDRLHLPGLAMLLVALKETNAKSVFSVSVERFLP